MDMFIALLTSLPTGNSTTRMRVWRALKDTGCGVLRDGVYVLPAAVPQAAALADVESAIRSAGGFAMTAELNFKTSAQLEHVRKLFDRGKEYAGLVARIGSAKAALSRLGERKADTLVQRLRRSLEELVGIDFYPGHAQLQAKQAVSALEGEKRRLFSEGEPQASRRKVRRLDATKFRHRTWATRKAPWVDRLASAWLIRRFIDREARFVWIDKPRDRPKGALGFDFDGADFTHVGDRVTFEVLLGTFDLDKDPALERLAAIVHFLDVGGIPVEEAKGLEMILKGARDNTRSDDELVLAAGKVFDHVYSAYQGAKGKP
ncbi:MAG TPA: chromate resistance protein ChrB domain-containing protein [Burkholderiales bacterium]|jgi:hypothetical protein|nr:chromate resistance protein ChrB domain-containing protein [Burkholderiales bacterium]